MRKINVLTALIGLFLFTANYILAQDRYYFAFNEKIFLNEVPNRFVLSFDNQHLPEIQASLQRNTQVRPADMQIENSRRILTIENADIETLRAYFSQQTGITSVNPLYITMNCGVEMGVTNEIVVQFKEHVSQQQIDEMNRRFDVEVRKVTARFLILSVPVELDPLEVANAYQRSGLVNFSHPNFLVEAHTFQTLPTDPFFIHQFYLHNVGQMINGRTSTAGADINVVPAWGITKGCSSIVVAVLDTGITYDHPDLPNTRQIRLPGSNFGWGNPDDPSPTGNDNHGNACAGIIAASHNNEGIAGIAPNTKIMPVRISFGQADATVYEVVATFAAAITFAKYNGADIISNSWGMHFFDQNQFPVMVDAIRDATINGRNGKGSVVIFAAGNGANHIR